MRYRICGVCLLITIILGVFVMTPFDAAAEKMNQVATQAMPTVTGTVSGPVVTVRSDGEQFVNVRSGPGLL